MQRETGIVQKLLLKLNDDIVVLTVYLLFRHQTDVCRLGCFGCQYFMSPILLRNNCRNHRHVISQSPGHHCWLPSDGAVSG